MAFCFSGSLLRANFNIVFSCFILLLFVANKFRLLPLLQHQASVYGRAAISLALLEVAVSGNAIVRTVVMMDRSISRVSVYGPVRRYL